MEIQTTLTLMIQAFVMGIAALMIFDFIGGLWVVPLPPAGWQPPVIEPSTVSTTAPQPTPAPQFEEIPDPWTIETQSTHHSAPASAVIVPFPTLRRLPPAIAQEVEPAKPKSKGAKSDTSRKSASTPKRQTTKPRKITA